MESEAKSVYPAIDINRLLFEDDDGSQKMVVTFHSIVRFKEDIKKGVALTLGTSYDLPAEIEESYPLELSLSDEFHKLALRVFNEGIDVLKEFNMNSATLEFDADDPGL